MNENRTGIDRIRDTLAKAAAGYTVSFRHTDIEELLMAYDKLRVVVLEREHEARN